MTRSSLTAALALLVTATGAPAQVALPASAERADPLRLEIDPGHSYIGFTVRHLMIGTVKGRFTRFSGLVVLDESDITRSAADVIIDVRSIDTGHQKRDSDLRGPDFFHADRFPRVTFAGTRVEKTSTGLVLVGDLTIRDVTKTVRIPFELTGPSTVGGRTRVGAEGTLRINRHDYGLTWNDLQEAIQVAGDEVKIELSIEAATPPRR